MPKAPRQGQGCGSVVNALLHAWCSDHDNDPVIIPVTLRAHSSDAPTFDASKTPYERSVCWLNYAHTVSSRQRRSYITQRYFLKPRPSPLQLRLFPRWMAARLESVGHIREARCQLMMGWNVINDISRTLQARETVSLITKHCAVRCHTRGGMSGVVALRGPSLRTGQPLVRCWQSHFKRCVV